jgi:hypothetical protein
MLSEKNSTGAAGALDSQPTRRVARIKVATQAAGGHKDAFLPVLSSFNAFMQRLSVALLLESFEAQRTVRHL